MQKNLDNVKALLLCKLSLWLWGRETARRALCKGEAEIHQESRWHGCLGVNVCLGGKVIRRWRGQFGRQVTAAPGKGIHLEETQPLIKTLCGLATLLTSLPYQPSFRSLNSGHMTAYSVTGTFQHPSHFRTFALAVPFSWDTFPPHPCLGLSHSLDFSSQVLHFKRTSRTAPSKTA